MNWCLRLCGILLWWLGASASLASETLPVVEASASAAKMAALAEALQRSAVMSGHFTQHKKLRVLKRPIVSHGQWHYWQDQGLVWDITHPIRSTLVLSPQGIREWRAGQAAAEATTREDVTGMLSMLGAILSLDLQTLEKEFTVAFAEETAAGDKVDATTAVPLSLALIPRAEPMAKVIARIELLTVKQATSTAIFLEKVIITEKNQNQTILAFSDVLFSDAPSETVRGYFAE